MSEYGKYCDYENPFSRLQGKVIKSVRGEPKGTSLYFDTDDDVISYYSEGECCSHSWFEHMEGLDNLIGMRVLETSVIDVKDVIEQSESEYGGRECIAQYGYRIKTEKGDCQIEMRNESNGFYGGTVEYCDNDPTAKILTEDF